MARYTGPSWRLSRRLGISLSETGKELRKRNYAPGQHGNAKRRPKLSEYGKQLQMKQTVRHMYGLNERQFRTTFDHAAKMKGKQGENFLFLLESRLDNLVYRMGLARTRRGARQLVNHGHIQVDGRRVDIPSYRVKIGQTISVQDKSRGNSSIKEALESNVSTLDFVTFDETSMSGQYLRLPERNELNEQIEESLIVEFYNR
ncbi:30S ribosomal protein S4 [Culicoidibacter larvae]|uniref:Small ribosomal subunit protein uS4 n=1 Tax=Culicoidibacter larvae TaxID=2579976 RepID=A0A5R8QBE0_9FIRM|nr:30S ribosomal protein S4 [Culicoidibacter larvae]TLG72911.1 30S ribosomal protein S4 [Culicoidibacter larvae]